MQEAGDQSEARRILLERCLRGDIAFAARDSRPQAREIELHNVASTNDEGQRQTTSEGGPGLPVSSFGPAVSKRRDSIDRLTANKSTLRRVINRILHLVTRFGPGGSTVRPFLHRLRGVRIGKHVWIGDDVYLDNDFPHCIELQDGAMIELRTTIIAHTHGAGRVVIGKNAFIGAGSVIVAASKRTLVIGEGSVIMASSMVNRSVAPYTLYGSDCAKPLARITQPLTDTTSYDDFITSLRPLRH